jgi:hypothetical protein
LKKLSRASVVGLVVAVALASFNITIPAGKPAASNWKFVLTHPAILLHVIMAAAVLIAAVVALAASIRGRDRSWIALSAAGLAFVLMAFIAGDQYVMSLQKSALNYMSVGWAGAVMYGTGLVPRPQERAPPSSRRPAELAAGLTARARPRARPDTRAADLPTRFLTFGYD